MSDPNIYTLPFCIACVLIALTSLNAWSRRRSAWGIPAIAVMATVFVWYVGDVLYNDFAKYHEQIGPMAIENAWWQVCIFVIAFAALTPLATQMIAPSSGHSHAVEILESRPFDRPEVQTKIDLFFRPLVVAWILLMLVGLIRVKFDFLGLFAPYLGHRANPWARNRVGGGIDAILSLASYFQIFLTAAFGVIFAIAKNPRTRWCAALICFAAFPYYLISRTRNTMLAIAVPGFAAWVFGRVRGRLPTKVALLVAGAMITSFWFSFVLANRTSGSIASAFTQAESFSEAAETKHLGLNMFGELSWINYFISNDVYEPSGGKRYFAEIVNPIPRSLWPDKPMIGIDYAIARGQGGGSDASAGVHATISTGMIGQGVVNFGPFFGPIAAALIMAVWVAVLARQDRLGGNPARLLLYAFGLILTFNMGRDITLLALYPFIFGLWMIIYWERKMRLANNGNLLDYKGRLH